MMVNEGNHLPSKNLKTWWLPRWRKDVYSRELDVFRRVSEAYDRVVGVGNAG